MRKNIVVTVLIMLTGLFAYAQRQCKDLEFEDGVARNLISPDFFNLVLNSDFLGCPQFNQGDSALCGKIVNSKGPWDIGLPDGLLFTILFHPAHYKFIKKILDDKFLAQSLATVPEPTKEALKWFDYRRHFNTILVPTTDGDVDNASYDEIQRKMIAIYYSIKSWTYCPERMEYGLMTVHGIFDNDNNIIIYNTACKASNIYQSRISDTALAFRLFFVCGHEFAHALDKMNGVLTPNPTSATRDICEKRANINGLILTRAYARLFQEMLMYYKNLIKDCSQCLPCDESYLKQTIKKWEKIDDYFVSKISEAKRVLNTGISSQLPERNNEWSNWACMEPQLLNTK